MGKSFFGPCRTFLKSLFVQKRAVFRERGIVVYSSQPWIFNDCSHDLRWGKKQCAARWKLHALSEERNLDQKEASKKQPNQPFDFRKELFQTISTESM